MLVGAVVVHHPDLLDAFAEDLDVVDFGFGDAGDASAEAKMISSAKRWAIWRAESSVGSSLYLLGEHLGVLEVLGVEEEAVDDQLARGDAEGAEGDHGCAGGRVGVALQLDLGGCAGRTGRHEALGDDVEDAGRGQVGVEGCVEGLLEGCGLGVGCAGLEVGDGDADGGDSGAGSGDDVVLARGGRDEQS